MHKQPELQTLYARSLSRIFSFSIMSNFNNESNQVVDAHFMSIVSSFINDKPTERHPQSECNPYNVSPRQIYCTSIGSHFYDMTTVDDIVFIGMCVLYGEVIPEENIQFTDEILQKMIEEKQLVELPQAQMPYVTTMSDCSYMYTSEYKHNKFEVLIMEQNKGTPTQRIMVRFTIVPRFTLTEVSEEECDQIELRVLDVIYTKLDDHFDFLKNEEWDKINERDEHSDTHYSNMC